MSDSQSQSKTDRLLSQLSSPVLASALHESTELGSGEKACNGKNSGSLVAQRPCIASARFFLGPVMRNNIGSENILAKAKSSTM